MEDQTKTQIEKAICKAMDMDMTHYNDQLDFQDGFVSGVSWARSLIEKETGTQLELLWHAKRGDDLATENKRLKHRVNRMLTAGMGKDWGDGFSDEDGYEKV